MMMKNLIKTLGFILAVVGLSVAIAARTDLPYSSNVIRNRVCIESEQIPGGEECADAYITIVDNQYACLSISGSHTIIPSNGKVEFVCRASDATKPHGFKIDCGNGDSRSGVGTGSFKYTCSYNDVTSLYYVSCIVDSEIPTNPSCNTVLNYGLPEYECGNRIIDTGEWCDLGGGYGQPIQCSDSSCTSEGKSDYYCKNCAIIHSGNFLYEPAECLYSDTPISVMNNEYLPYWWNLWIKKDSQQLTDDETDCYPGYDDSSTTLLLKDSMECHFAVYNGSHNQNGDPIQRFTEKCYNNKFNEYAIFDYFEEHHHGYASGANFNTVNAVSDGYGGYEFGEYKLVLEKVDYKVCNNGSWVPGIRYGAICEVNFAITKPYIMQISTFGVNPVSTDSEKFLDDYYDMYGNKILTKTDLNSVITTDNKTYAVDTNVKSKFEEFKNKYESLAVEVTSTMGGSKSIWDVLGLNANDVSLKKVPNKSIYFIKKKDRGSTNTLVLSQESIKNLTTAYTIIVEGMDVEIVGNVLQYAMIVTDRSMSFKDAGGKDSMSCADGGQVVQGIYVALGGFKAANESLRNTNPDKLWCPWGGLHVKGVLIGDGIKNISNNKRSNLNSWFNASSANESVVRRARRETIIKGASLLIEYSPSLWKTLPPGAEIFTENLEVYRK